MESPDRQAGTDSQEVLDNLARKEREARQERKVIKEHQESDREDKEDHLAQQARHGPALQAPQAPPGPAVLLGAKGSQVLGANLALLATVTLPSVSAFLTMDKDTEVHHSKLSKSPVLLSL